MIGLRQDSGYYMASAVIIGLGMHDALGSIYLLLSKARAASQTPIWRLSAVVWIFLAAFLASQATILDYFISPYVVPKQWFGQVLFCNYFFHMITSLGVSLMLLLRLRVFYSPKSAIFLTMIAIGTLFWIFNTVGDVLGIFTAVDLWNNEFLRDDDDPWFFYSRASLVVGFCLEAAFTTVGSVGFLYALGKGGGRSRKETIYRIVFQKDGLNLLAINGINFLIAIFGVHSMVYGFNFVTRSCLFLPSWSYGLQFATFLKDSYISARRLIEENSTRLNGSSSKYSSNA
ncbi:hypothetical protein HDV03_002806 [Kappamyces sp. JEL0829]|nr:hypothetical protein HDV03_002806 [Kappamyces sp. JEL0829]